MAYLHRHSFSSEQAQQMLYYPHLSYAHYPPPAQHMEHFFPAYPAAEYAEFAHPAYLQDDFDETGEVSTRPRLTKEQVEVLETVFAANHKPNSIVKRQLAMQTKLTLPRVANWFQNRRAKAKQQRKQEEFEITQSMGAAQGWKSEDNLIVHLNEDAQLKNEAASPQDAPDCMTARSTTQERPSSTSAASTPDAAKEASWASLQRALTAAQAARVQTAQEEDQNLIAMPPHALPSANHHSSVRSQSQDETLTRSQSLPVWPESVHAGNSWASLQAPDAIPFDFGFEQPQAASSSSATEDGTDFSLEEFTNTSFSAPLDSWADPLQTPTFPHHQASEQPGATHSPLHMQSYSSSRRGSTTEDLATNFGNFALAGTPPTRPPMPALDELEPFKRVEGEIDLAARRKGPRPANIGTAALRSRSYGALTTLSPTMRSNSSLSNTHAIRHVKSTGHSLNARFAGIRKPSSAQRSPLNISTFAEAEAFNSLVGQQNMGGHISDDAPAAATSTSYLSPEMLGATQLPIREHNNMAAQMAEVSQRYSPYTIHQLHPSMTSPPSTPFRPDYMFHSQAGSMMPPASAPPQYASFPDYTPPYSAGPLTSSSWSDAPFASPDLPNFPPVAHIPNLSFPQQHDNMMSFHQFMMPSDHKQEQSPTMNSEAKKTEFVIQEFPGQKKEHAHVAQQLAQQKPKNYVFAHATPSDF